MINNLLKTFFRYRILLCLLSIPFIGSAQEDQPALQFQGYAELYYAYDFNQPENHQRPSFLYSHNRHNEVNLNLGFVKASYAQDKVRANLALGTGTYMIANYAQEPDLLRIVYEANAGLKLSRTQNLWVDAGIFSSHIGFESAVSLDCPTLTRSMAAENSPYYESGVKISYTTHDDKWLFSGMYLNGWQRIQRPDGNNTPAFGTQITYTPGPRFKINYSTFFGNDKPDDLSQLRIFNDLYSIIHISERWKAMLGVDVGFEEKSTGGDGWNTWYNTTAILQYKVAAAWDMAARYEYYDDRYGVIIPSVNLNGFRTHGLSLNADYRIMENAAWRIEGRWLKSKDRIFEDDNAFSHSNFCLTTSIAIHFH